MAPALRNADPQTHVGIRNVSKSFGALNVLNGIDLDVQRGEFVSLLGPSGCGKTTLLRAIAGLATVDRGSIAIGGRDVTNTPANKRGIGMVFQSYALFPHLSVADNVAFGLRARGVAKHDAANTVGQMLSLVQMGGYADRRIQALSGGQQQRVALARALATRPQVMLFDEPFSALDRKLRESMEMELRSLLRNLAISAVFVTHDQEEALIMSDRIAVMNRGKIDQFARPTEIYSQPATPFTLEFVGTSTRIHGTVEAVDEAGIAVRTQLGDLRTPNAGGQTIAVADSVILGVRPDKIRWAPTHGRTENRVRVELADRVYMGSKLAFHFKAQGKDLVILEAQSTNAPSGSPGELIDLYWDVHDTLLFNASA